MRAHPLLRALSSKPTPSNAPAIKIHSAALPTRVNTKKQATGYCLELLLLLPPLLMARRSSVTPSLIIIPVMNIPIMIGVKESAVRLLLHGEE